MVGETQEQSEDSEGYLTQLVLEDEKKGLVPAEGRGNAKAPRHERAQ